MITETISTKSPRTHSVDALRGFAVMAILLVHNLEHFIFPVYPTDSSAWLETIDKYVFDTVFFLFAGKAYAIFALLFGFTYYIQYRNQQARGGDFSGRFMWRLLLLAGFACINAAFFPAGDVLLLFSVVGGILVLMRRQSDRCVLAVAILLLMQPVEWIYLLSYLFVPGFHTPDLNVGQMYSDVAAVTRSGNFADFILCNITLGQKASFLWAVNAGRLTQTAGLFLIGFLLGRRQLFVQSDNSLAVAQSGLHLRAYCRFCDIVLPYIIQPPLGCASTLRKNESHQLHNAIDFRSTHIFYFRTVPCAPLRLYRKPGDRPAGICRPDYLQPLVARASPPGPTGISLA